MKKNNEGVTLVSLVTTVIIILIIGSIVIPVSEEIINNSKMKRYIAIMYLIKTETEKIYESYEFDNTKTELTLDGKALKVDFNTIELTNEIINNEEIDISKNDFWYKYTKTTLDYLNIDTQKVLKNVNNDYFFINYATGEVIYNNGVELKNNNKIYSLKGLIKYDENN